MAENRGGEARRGKGGEMKTEPALIWGMRVDGERPYIAHVVHTCRGGVEPHCTQRYHRPVRVAVLPVAEYKRLLRIEKSVAEKEGK